MVQGRNTLGYLRTRTFYIPQRKYAYKYASITKCLTCSPREMQKKSLNIHSHVRSNSRTWRVLTLKFVGHFSGVSRTFWEEYVRPESMIVDTLGVYCMYLFVLLYA